jgi:phage terminase large subunit-like protein
MTVEFRDQLASALESGWRSTARPNQLAPDGDWFIWLLLAGRGFGKTRTLSEWVVEQVARGAARRIGLIGATAADTRDVIVEGASGILAVSPDWCRPDYEPSKRRLTWPNGAIATCYSADEPQRLRGPQHDALIIDELAAWRRIETFDMAMFGLRLGERPRCVIATTPRPTKLIKELLSREGDDVVVTRGTSYENRANLAPDFFKKIVGKYEGTRLGRQELLGEMLSDTPGALWNLTRIDELRRDSSYCPELARVVVAIDPAGSAEGDETGIVVAGVDADGHGWVLVDASGQYEPTQWAHRAVQLYHSCQADRIVAETNFGGGMVESTIRAVDRNVPFRNVTASRGKAVRAEPIAALYEQGKVHHLGSFPELEDQQCEFTSHFDRARAGYSPGRVDALCWALSDLMTSPMKSWGTFEVYRCQALGIPIGPPRRPAQPDTRVPWRRAYDEILSRPTPDHPESSGGAVEHVNGPRAKLTYAPGSIEFELQQKEKTGS